MGNIRHKILDTLREDWLNTQYDSAQSFYKKARTEEDGNKLYSYDTLVAEVKNGKPVIYNAQSQTTRRHIREFLKQKGFTEDEIHKAIFDFKKSNGGWKPKVEESFDSVQYWGSVNQYNYTKRQLRVDYDNKTYEIGDFKWSPDHKVSNKEIDRKIEELKAAGFKEIKKDNVQESAKPDKNKKPTKRLVMNQGNVYIFEQSKGSKKSYIVGEDIDKDANTIEKVNRYNNQNEAFTDFFARVGIDPNNELKESIKKATKSKRLKETDLYVYSNAESEDKSDASSMIYSKYKPEAKKLSFQIHKEGPMYFVDFLGAKEDIKDYLKKLGWYTDEEIEEYELIKPLDESYKIYQVLGGNGVYNSQEVDEVETEEQAQDRVAELRAETGNNAYYEEVKDKEEPLKESGTLWTSETTEDDYDKEELKANQYQDYLDNFDGTVKPEDYEDWKDSDWLYNYLYYDFNNEDNEYSEWYDFINSYAEEDLKRYYQDYLDDINEREPNKPKEFEDWFNDYMIDDADDQWRFKEEDLKDNILPMIDKQINGAIFITGDYFSRYPEFKKSGPGGKIVTDGDDLINWLSEEDQVDITYDDNEQLIVKAYNHDGSISGLLYTLPDDPHKILEIALSTGYYDKNDYEDNNDIINEFMYDLEHGNVNMHDVKKVDTLVPIVNGFRTGIVENIKESEDIAYGEYIEPTQIYTIEDLDNMEAGYPVAVELKSTVKSVDGEPVERPPIVKTSLFAGKDDDGKYIFYDGSGFSGLFKFSPNFINSDKVRITNGVDLAELATLTDELKKNNK